MRIRSQGKELAGRTVGRNAMTWFLFDLAFTALVMPASDFDFGSWQLNMEEK